MKSIFKIHRLVVVCVIVSFIVKPDIVCGQEDPFKKLNKAFKDLDGLLGGKSGKKPVKEEAGKKYTNKVVRELAVLAEKGDAKAQFELAEKFYYGKGVEKDYVHTFKWASRSAAQDNPKAQYRLAILYQLGRGISKDENKSKALFDAAKGGLLKLAEQNDSKAQFYLGGMYYFGDGVPQDYKVAVKWRRKAAEQGDASAQSILAYAYQTGKGVEKDDKEAVKWYRKAAEQGDAIAQNNLGKMYRLGQGVEKDEKEGFKWHRKAAEQGDEDAQNTLGYAYAVGQGVEKDEKEGFKWFHKAAEQGNILALSNLVKMYRHGIGVEKNEQEAVKWSLKAEEQRLKVEQQRNLALTMEDVVGTYVLKSYRVHQPPLWDQFPVWVQTVKDDYMSIPSKLVFMKNGLMGFPNGKVAIPNIKWELKEGKIIFPSVLRAGPSRIIQVFYEAKYNADGDLMVLGAKNVGPFKAGSFGVKDVDLGGTFYKKFKTPSKPVDKTPRVVLMEKLEALPDTPEEIAKMPLNNLTRLLFSGDSSQLPGLPLKFIPSIYHIFVGPDSDPAKAVSSKLDIAEYKKFRDFYWKCRKGCEIRLNLNRPKEDPVLMKKLDRPALKFYYEDNNADGQISLAIEFFEYFLFILDREIEIRYRTLEKVLEKNIDYSKIKDEGERSKALEELWIIKNEIRDAVLKEQVTKNPKMNIFKHTFFRDPSKVENKNDIYLENVHAYFEWLEIAHLKRPNSFYEKLNKNVTASERESLAKQGIIIYRPGVNTLKDRVMRQKLFEYNDTYSNIMKGQASKIKIGAYGGGSDDYIRAWSGRFNNTKLRPGESARWQQYVNAAAIDIARYAENSFNKDRSREFSKWKEEIDLDRLNDLIELKKVKSKAPLVGYTFKKLFLGMNFLDAVEVLLERRKDYGGSFGISVYTRGEDDEREVAGYNLRMMAGGGGLFGLSNLQAGVGITADPDGYVTEIIIGDAQRYFDASGLGYDQMLQAFLNNYKIKRMEPWAVIETITRGAQVGKRTKAHGHKLEDLVNNLEIKTFNPIKGSDLAGLTAVMKIEIRATKKASFD